MKVKFGIIFSFSLVIIMTSCISSKKIPYLQTGEKRDGSTIANIPSHRLENMVRFQPDDILGITVNVPGEQAVASDYNLPLVPAATTENSTESRVDQGMGRQGYLVSKEGTIDFPVFGKIKVAGLTQSELEDYLKELLLGKLEVSPVVTVRLLNFRIIITGEVGSPGPITVDRDNINILQALAMAGDMTIYGRRDNITLLRQKQDGEYMRVTLDISKEDIISSPYYFLQQNDVIYVTPVKARAQSADISPMFSLILSSTTFAMSLITFIIWLRKN